MNKLNVAYFLEDHKKIQPDKVAFYSNGKVVNYNDFHKNAFNFAGLLTSKGIGKGDRLLVVAPMSAELYVTIVGLQIIGAIPVLLDSFTRKEQLIQIMKNSEPCGIICFEDWAPHFESFFDMMKYKIILNNETLNLPNSNIDNIVEVSEDDTALLTYTTGSSGVPKGVDRTHGFLRAQHDALKRLFPYKEDDIDLPVFPVFTLNNLASGITTVIPDINISQPTPDDSKILINQINRYKVTTMTLAPSSFKNLGKYCLDNDIELFTMKRVLTGGAPISEKDIKQFTKITPNSKNWILYGSTEVEPISIIEASEIDLNLPKDNKDITKIGVNVGCIDPELKYKLIDFNFEYSEANIDISSIEVLDGDVGELIVSGRNVSKRYYRNQDAFIKTKIVDMEEVIWHRTGDLARIDDQNNLWIVGRKHNVIKYKDGYIFPVRPEIILKEIDGVTNSAYLLTDNNKITAVITMQENIENSEEIYNKIIEIFKKEDIPVDDITFLETIPMDVRHHSKVDYSKLRQILNNHD